MLKLTDLKPGVVFKFNSNPYIVISSEHSKLGRGGAILRSKIKDLLTGAIISRTFKGSDTFDEVDIQKVKMQYLYCDNNEYYFMNPETFEQFSLNKEAIGDGVKFLKAEENVYVMIYEGKPINIDLPIKVDLKVTYTEPGFKGNTQSTAFKPAKLETGGEVDVPLFIKIGDIIRIDTRTGSYVERA